MQEREQERKGPQVEPIEPLVFRKPNGDEIKVNALGYAMVKPALDIHQTTTTPGGRTRFETIGFTPSEFDELHAYINKAKKHWEATK